uniref:Pleckstrin homology-like domain, family A, member 3 n=1 Tax=Cyclopterus lumpus TaxID=8103 RepID=A0A8C2ZIW6_CYCLU
MSFPAKVMRDGQLEKRSSGLLQLWKKKRCVLTEEGLRLHDCKGGGDAPSSAWSSKAKELRFERMATVDCVETARRGTRRLRWHWCAIRTCRPCRRDGTGTCPQHTWAALGRMRSSDLVNVNLPRMEAYYFLGVNQSEWGRVEDTRPISLILSCTA